MKKLSLENDNIIFYEMMAHPALFSHRRPANVLVLGDVAGGILNEVLKHPNVKAVWYPVGTEREVNDVRAHSYVEDNLSWMKGREKKSLDIVINADMADQSFLSNFFHLLHDEGMLIQQTTSLFHWEELQHSAQQIKTAGFGQFQMLNFPQPSFSSGWRSAFMVPKKQQSVRVREKDIYNRLFKTVYYNFDMHQAALVLPECLREEGLSA